MNITDVDDKTIKKSMQSNEYPSKTITENYTSEFMNDIIGLRLIQLIIIQKLLII